MNTRQTWIFGLAALGLALAAPVRAAPDLLDDAFIVAKNDRGGAVRPEPRDPRQDAPPEGDKRQASKSKGGHEESQGYGYGYERRQKPGFEADDRSRGRR